MKTIEITLQNPNDYSWLKKEMELAGFSTAPETSLISDAPFCSFVTDNLATDDEITECIEDILTRRNSNIDNGISPVVGDIVTIR